LLRTVVEDQQELRLDIMRGENRIKELQMPRGVGGFGLADDTPQVVAERQKLDRKRADQRRLASIYEDRAATWQHAANLVRVIEQAMAARRSGCVAAMVVTEPPGYKNSIIDTVESRRRRGRELQADLAKVRAAPWPSALAKQKMRARIAQLAEAGAPHASDAIDHDEPIEFRTGTVQVRIANVDPSAVGFVALPDTLALIAWLHRDTLIAALDREIDEVADDKAALTLEQRRKAEAEILADMLATEREECALIEIAQTQGTAIDYRTDCDPRAILGIEWVAPGQ
jgi:hypothetical protein